MHTFSTLCFALVFAQVSAPKESPSEAPDGANAHWFTDVTASALPGVTIECGSPDKDWILEVNGGGVGLADLDRDGDLDLVVVGGGDVAAYRADAPAPSPRVFLNRGDGTFEPGGDAWVIAPAVTAGFGAGLALGDFTGDGWIDLVTTGLGADRVFRNEGGRGFVELAPLPRSEGWTTSAAFLDYDHDGRLDLVVTGYLVPELDEARRRAARWKGQPVMVGPEGLVPLHDRLYRGRGDGEFEDVSVAAGFRPEVAGYGLGVITLDEDRDGWVDLYVSNDSTPNHLWHNRGDGTFEERGFRLGVSHDAAGREQAGMGLAVDDDAGLVFVTNFSGESNALYARTPSGRAFRERSARMGLAGPSLAQLGWGTGFGDLDLDGDQDLFVLNGHVYPAADAPGTDARYAQPNQLFERVGDEFRARPLEAGGPRVSRAGVLGDLDRDGDLDLVATEVNGPVRILRNDAPRAPDAHWLIVRPRGADGSPAAIGALVELRCVHTRADGTTSEATSRRELRSAGGFQASAPLEAHFGIAAGPVGSVLGVTVEVRWPGRPPTVLANVTLDQVLFVDVPERAQSAAPKKAGSGR